MSIPLYRVYIEIQRGDSPMSRDGQNWGPDTLATLQARLDQASGPEGWARLGYRVRFCIATAIEPPHERIEMEAA